MLGKGINIDALSSINEDLEKHESDLAKNDCFVTKSANTWIEEAKRRPIPNMLFGALWFEGEICILFSDTNTGKSVLAVQIAEAISRGKSIQDFSTQTSPQKTVYFDFELSDKQFEKRYSNNYKDHYQFSPNLIRAEINPDVKLPKEFSCFEDFLVKSIVEVIQKYNAKVVIVDNLTYLREDNEKAKNALPLMKHLKAINKKYGVSVLVLAHTPKRDYSKPITKNDLAGSKMLINFCDSAFALGVSTEGHDLRYVKQIKQRNTECVYHSENVALMRIHQDFNFLKFHFVDFDCEANHLKAKDASERKNRLEKIQELKSQGLSNVDIAERLGISEGTVRYNLKKIEH
ncbi:winged helix-turn-helix DNA-binding protein [Winogradskyella wandonensis]|uniref:Winged helix-turn-helix DNA-binding protein n=1 Tax=Winogradskyella wandonensis TaxID=1442586 RepID=A0A4R1KQG4_9FLAO|nr:AAA family ATPase [Winogradskyella wandonensis]TCK67252.1 winged helix-turn-helix DNA-binding protein [Winogradskyella wandonensis]